MKKVLLLMTLLLTLGFSALAAEYTFTMSDIYGSTTITPSATSSWGDFNITLAKGSNGTAPGFNKAGDLRLYVGNIMTITSPAANITKISFTISTQGKQRGSEVTVSTGEMAQSGTPDFLAEWTGNANEIEFTAGANKYGTSTSAGQFCFSEVTITTSDEGVAVLAPVFSIGSGNVMAGTEVELTCDTEGAAIYYTTDGTEPTDASTLYTAPIAINEAMTIKAIAIKGADKSSVSTATYSLIEVVNTLAKAKTYGDKETLKYEGDLTIVYKNGANVYVYDGTEYALVYGTINGEAGQVIKGGWEATVSIYYGLFELKPAGTPTVEGTAEIPAPTEITAANLAEVYTTANISAYCVVKDVTIAAETPATNTSFTGKLGDAEVTFYNTFKFASQAAGIYDVTGFISIYNKNLQFIPAVYDLKQAFEVVEAPVFNPEAGSVLLGTEVEITCATEGATIYYTEDGTEPTAESIEYTGAIEIDEAKTIKAIAIKGNGKSEVVTAEYTIRTADEPASVEFVMSEIYPMTADVTSSRWGDYYIECGKGAATTTSVPRYYSTGPDLRLYAKNIITIANPNVAIVKIVFEVSNNGLKRLAPITASVGGIETQAAGDKTVTWVGKSQEITFTVGDKANYGTDGAGSPGQFCFSKVTIYYEEVPVCAPVFSVASRSVNPGTEVELTSATEGVEIYYTTDGTEPTDASTKYTAPIVINEPMTIKAIAYKGADKSAVWSATYDILYTVSTLAEVKVLPDGANIRYTGDLTLIYIATMNGFVYDGTDYSLLYVSLTSLNPKPGDVLKGGWDGTIQIYNGQFRIVPASTKFTTIEGNVELPAPIEVTDANVVDFYTAANQNSYCEIKNVEFKAALPTSNYATFNGYVGDTVVKFRNNFGIEQVEIGKYDVTGILAVSTNSLQFWPLEYKPAQTSGIDAIEAGNEAPAQYYNLNGMRIDNPAAGQVVIRVQDGKAAKIRF